MPRPILPLPLASIERLHWFDDPPAFPNNIFARLTFAGSLDESLAREAFRLALARHVRGTARIGQWGRQWAWIDDIALPPELIWQPTSTRGQHPPVDLSRQPGCRVVFSEVTGECQATWQVHHALVDGLGGLQFIHDWMIYYDNLHAGREPDTRLAPLDPQRLRQRNVLGLWSRRYLAQWWRQPIALFGASKFLWRRFQTIDGPPIDPYRSPLADDYPAVRTRGLPREASLALRRAAVGLRVTTNSLLVAAAFGATHDLLTRQGHGADPRCLRVIVPISIRTPADQQLPAANRASLVQLDRRPGELHEPRGLAQGIDYEMRLIRRWQLDRMFLIAVRANAVSDRWLRARVARQAPRATTMMTNLGRPLLKSPLAMRGRRLVVGHRELQRLEVMAPIRAAMPVSLAAVEYAGEWAVTAHYDSRVLAAASVDTLLDELMARLASFIS